MFSNYRWQNWLNPYRVRKSSTVRYAFPLFLATSLVLTASVLNLPNDATVQIHTNTTQMRVGQQVTVDIRVSTPTPVNAVSIMLPIDETVFSVEEINISDSVIAIWTQSPELKNGDIILEGGTTRRGFVGEHSIATIIFTAQTTGMVTLEPRQVELVAGDGTGTVTELDVGDLPTAELYIEEGTEQAETTDSLYAQAIQKQLGIAGKPTLRDVSRFLAAWTDRSVLYDFNQDGKMTFTDFAIILAHTAY